jgi:hypothetical protein
MKLHHLYANATAGARICHHRHQRLARCTLSFLGRRCRPLTTESSQAATLPNCPTWFLLADTHIAEKTLPRLNVFFNKFFFSEFEIYQPSQILFLGDTFHIRGGTDPTHHRFFTDILERILAAPWSPQVHLLVGNQ